MTTRRPVSLFVSSADADTAPVSRLLEALSPWLKASLHMDYTLWDYRSNLVTGLPFEDQILTALDSADYVLAMVSPPWLASWFSMTKELPVALAQCKLIPILFEKVPMDDRSPHALDLRGVGRLQIGIYRNSRGDPKGFVDLRDAADRKAYARWLSQIIATRVQAP